ncbi:MAG: hypothetical protein H6Q90_6904 [Deltaproteobacteria bacterium]|nr:hypothetical protein [Deltaproteobacteria bacterium]
MPSSRSASATCAACARCTDRRTSSSTRRRTAAGETAMVWTSRNPAAGTQSARRPRTVATSFLPLRSARSTTTVISIAWAIASPGSEGRGAVTRGSPTVHHSSSSPTRNVRQPAGRLRRSCIRRMLREAPKISTMRPRPPEDHARAPRTMISAGPRGPKRSAAMRAVLLHREERAGFRFGRGLTRA